MKTRILQHHHPLPRVCFLQRDVHGGRGTGAAAAVVSGRVRHCYGSSCRSSWFRHCVLSPKWCRHTRKGTPLPFWRSASLPWRNVQRVSNAKLSTINLLLACDEPLGIQRLLQPIPPGVRLRGYLFPATSSCVSGAELLEDERPAEVAETPCASELRTVFCLNHVCAHSDRRSALRAAAPMPTTEHLTRRPNVLLSQLATWTFLPALELFVSLSAP